MNLQYVHPQAGNDYLISLTPEIDNQEETLNLSWLKIFKSGKGNLFRHYVAF